MSKKMMTKIITAVVMIAVCVPIVIIGGMALDVLLVAIIGLAAYEIASLADQKTHVLFTAVNFIAMLGLTYLPREYFPAITAIVLVCLFIGGLVDENEPLDHIVYSFTIIMLVSIAVRCVNVMYSVDSLGVYALLFVAIACFGTDTMAYFFGVFLGKHKMIPRVSPNKTWEGSIGGYFGGFALSFAFGYFFCQALPMELLLCASAVLPIIAQVGDLSFSLIKRRFEIKDFGNIFPEHGGVLDRIDSLIFCLMIFNALLIIWSVI